MTNRFPIKDGLTLKFLLIRNLNYYNHWFHSSVDPYFKIQELKKILLAIPIVKHTQCNFQTNTCSLRGR